MRVNSISLFKSGIKPAWEDEVNGQGGDFYFRFSDMTMDIRDIWEKMVQEIVCENYPFLEEITGIRAIDKSRKGNLTYKLEFWTRFSNAEGEAGLALRAFISDRFINKDPKGNPDQVLNFQTHKTSFQNLDKQRSLHAASQDQVQAIPAPKSYSVKEQSSRQ